MDKINLKISYYDDEWTYIQIMEKQVKALRQTINNDEKYIGFKIDCNWETTTISVIRI